MMVQFSRMEGEKDPHIELMIVGTKIFFVTVLIKLEWGFLLPSCNWNGVHSAVRFDKLGHHGGASF